MKSFTECVILENLKYYSYSSLYLIQSLPRTGFCKLMKWKKTEEDIDEGGFKSKGIGVCYSRIPKILKVRKNKHRPYFIYIEYIEGLFREEYEEHNLTQDTGLGPSS